MSTPTPSLVAYSLASDRVSEIGQLDLELEERLPLVLATIAILIEDIDELDLRGFLKMGGVDLEDWDQYLLTKAVAAWFIEENVIKLLNRFEDSIYDGPALGLEHDEDADTKFMNSIRAGRAHFRDAVLPGVNLFRD